MPFGLFQAHATSMILSWMFFASIGVPFARYGRSIRFGRRRQLLGKAVWFQVHRFLLSLVPIFTLLGFLCILIYASGTWVSPQGPDFRRFIHSICGGTIVCCVMIQLWLALYRCHPHSRYRFIFDWSHRIIGFFTYTLSIPTISLMISVIPSNRISNIITVSTWAAWNVTVLSIFEKIERKQRAVASTAVNNTRVAGNINQDQNTNRSSPIDIETGPNAMTDNHRLNVMKLFLFFIHTIVNMSLSILLIVFICT